MNNDVLDRLTLADVKDIRPTEQSVPYLEGLGVALAFRDRALEVGASSHVGKECFTWIRYDRGTAGLFAIFHEHGVDPMQELRDRMGKVVEHA